MGETEPHYRKVSCCLQHRHPLWALVILLPFQLPANVTRKAAEDGPKSLDSSHTQENGKKFLVLVLWLVAAIYGVNHLKEDL